MTGRNEIDQLLDDLVHRHESANPTVEVGVPEVGVEVEVGVPEVGRQRRFRAVVVGGLLALFVLGFASVGFVAGVRLFGPGEASSTIGGGGPADAEPISEQQRGVATAEVDTASTEETTLSTPTTVSVPSVVLTPAPSPVSAIRVGMVLPGDAFDRGFSQSMVDGAAALRELGGIGEVDTVEHVGSASARSEIRRMAEEGHELVIAHSSTFQAIAFEVAAEYPDVVFAVAGTDPPPLPNVYTYTVAAEEGGYLLGALSAMLSSTGVVGIVGPIEVGVSERFVHGFRHGAADEQADLDVLVAYAGSFTDADAFVAAASDQLDAGADVITGHGNELDAAIAAAADRGAEWLGSQTDQAPVSPRSVVASQVYQWDVVIDTIIAEIDAEAVDGRHLVANLANGGIVIRYNDANQTDAEIQGRVDELRAELVSGELRPLFGR